MNLDLILFYLFVNKIREYEPSLINKIMTFIKPINKYQVGDILILNPEVKLNYNYDESNRFRIKTYDNKLTEFRKKKFDCFDDYFKEKNNLIKQLYFSYYVKIKNVEMVYGKHINYNKYIYIHYITGYHYSPEYFGEYFLIESCKNIDYSNFCYEEQLDKLNNWEQFEFDIANYTSEKRMRRFYL